METAPRELAVRLERLEHDFEEVTRAMIRESSRPHPDGDPLARVSLGTWLRISGPTFAVMVFGFTLLWNTQQATSAQVLEVTRTMGRLDGAITRLETRVDSMDETLQAMGGTLQSMDGTLRSMNGTLQSTDGTLGALQESIDVLGRRQGEP